MTNNPRTGRNDLCPCGSKKKYKKCHGVKEGSRGNTMLMIIVGLLIAGGAVAAVTKFMNPDRGRSMGVWSPEHGHYH